MVAQDWQQAIAELQDFGDAYGPHRNLEARLLTQGLNTRTRNSLLMDIKHVLTELSAYPEGTFLDLQSFNGQSFGACHITGISPVWEMHPDTDEFFHILDGEFTVMLLDQDEPSHYVIPAGSIFVVPKGIWNKPGAPNGAKFMYFTPGQTLHSNSENPRLA